MSMYLNCSTFNNVVLHCSTPLPVMFIEWHSMAQKTEMESINLTIIQLHGFAVKLN